MKKGELDSAVRRAFNVFDEWNDVTGTIEKHTSVYYELQSVIEDAVHCGAQAALGLHEPLSRYITTNRNQEEVVQIGSGLTDNEEKVMNSIVAAWNTWQNLLMRVATGEERQEFRDGIHQIQQVLGNRALHRLFPKYWN